jgi:5-methylthioadenosine/S-adenosylhomocysteine deaminase
MPGFKNAHTHSAMTFLRSLADDMPLQEWLYEQVFPREEKLTAEAVYAFSKVAILEYLTSGITANFDMYFFYDAFVKANIECGFRTVMCGSMNNFDPDPTQLERDFVRFNQVHPLIGYRLGFHAEYTTSLDRMEYVASLADQYKVPVYTHSSETRRETEECKKRYGKTPTELLESLNLFRYGGGGFHSVYLTESDMDIYQKRGVFAIINPGSNLKLASGIAPVCKMMNKNIGLAIGTDGPASNNALDMFREMYLVSVLQKLSNQDASACNGEKVLEMATVGGARAMGLHECDTLQEGKQADMIVIDMHRPNMQPINHITKNLVYSGSKDNVKLTMIAGKILYEDGKFYVGEKVEDIYARANAWTRKIMEG